MTLWIASGNPAKTGELRELAEIYFPGAAVAAREPRNVVENAATFAGNAGLKSRALADELAAEGHRGFMVLGDDSGLCVDLLDGRPGVHSGRYAAGAGSNSRANLEKVLAELGALTTDLSKRTGRYVCALSLVQVDGSGARTEFSAEGSRAGLLGLAPQGPHGYAYDSVFLDPVTKLSYGEIPREEKQRDSHRRRAFENLRRALGAE